MKVPQLITDTYLKRWKKNSLFSALLWAVMGIILIFTQDHISIYTCYILGTVLLIQGIPHLFLFIAEEEKHIFSISSLVNGILISFVGIWSLTLSEKAMYHIPNIIAFVTLLHGFKDLELSKRIRVLDTKMGLLALLISIFTIFCSALILALPLDETKIVVIASGLLLIMDGIGDFWMWCILTDRSNEQRGI